jgi:tetratricopeptide (TPR) repeat protein
MTKTIALIAALLVPAIAIAAPGDEATDYDHELEQHSKFWSRVINPNKKLYDALLERANKLIGRSDKQSRAETSKLIGRAIRLAPKRPEAWWALGALHDRKREWEACAKARAKAFKLDPEWKMSSRNYAFRRNATTFEEGLGRCLAQAGHYEQALEQFKRAMAKATRYQVYRAALRVGEIYMALGRLREAIATLQQAARNHYQAAPKFALAVAYDRDEQLAKAREWLDQAMRRDPSLSRLESGSYHQITPAYDRAYYKGLARERKLEHERALYHFREFVHLAPKSPWVRRAKQHIKELERTVIESKRARVETRGASIDQDKVRAVLTKASPRLQACVAALPNAVFETRVGILVTRTNVKKKDKKKKKKKKPVVRRPPPPRYRYGRHGRRGRYGRIYRRRIRPPVVAPIVAGYSTRVRWTWAKDQTRIASATACIDNVVKALDFPKPRGVKGQGVRIIFPVIKR